MRAQHPSASPSERRITRDQQQEWEPPIKAYRLGVLATDVIGLIDAARQQKVAQGATMGASWHQRVGQNPPGPQTILP
jgi:hypothetical protein